MQLHAARCGVDVRKLELHLPQARLKPQASRAYPLTSPSGSRSISILAICLIRRAAARPGMNRYGHAGRRRFPSSHRPGRFPRQLTGSLVDPHLAGTAKATQISVEVPAANSGRPFQNSRKVARLFSIWTQWKPRELHGERITIQHGCSNEALPPSPSTELLTQHRRRIPSGSCVRREFDAARAPQRRPVDARDLLQIAGEDLPLTGTFDAQIQVEGQLHAPMARLD